LGSRIPQEKVKTFVRELLLVLKIVKLPLEMQNPTPKKVKKLLRTTSTEDCESQTLEM
jgi:hypothetical protein